MSYIPTGRRRIGCPLVTVEVCWQAEREVERHSYIWFSFLSSQNPPFSASFCRRPSSSTLRFLESTSIVIVEEFGSPTATYATPHDNLLISFPVCYNSLFSPASPIMISPLFAYPIKRTESIKFSWTYPFQFSYLPFSYLLIISIINNLNNKIINISFK